MCIEPPESFVEVTNSLSNIIHGNPNEVSIIADSREPVLIMTFQDIHDQQYSVSETIRLNGPNSQENNSGFPDSPVASAILNEGLPLARSMLRHSESHQVPTTTGDPNRSRLRSTAIEAGVVAAPDGVGTVSTEAEDVAVHDESGVAVTEAEAGEASDNQVLSTSMATNQLLVLITTYNALKLAIVLSSFLATFQPLAKEKSPAAGWVTAAIGICAASMSFVLLFMEWRNEWLALNVSQQRKDQADHLV